MNDALLGYGGIVGVRSSVQKRCARETERETVLVIQVNLDLVNQLLPHCHLSSDGLR